MNKEQNVEEEEEKRNKKPISKRRTIAPQKWINKTKSKTIEALVLTKIEQHTRKRKKTHIFFIFYRLLRLLLSLFSGFRNSFGQFCL